MLSYLQNWQTNFPKLLLKRSFFSENLYLSHLNIFILHSIYLDLCRQLSILWPTLGGFQKVYKKFKQRNGYIKTIKLNILKTLKTTKKLSLYQMSDAQSPNLILAKASSSRLVGKNSLNFSVLHRIGAAIKKVMLPSSHQRGIFRGRNSLPILFCLIEGQFSFTLLLTILEERHNDIPQEKAKKKNQSHVFVHLIKSSLQLYAFVHTGD